MNNPGLPRSRGCLFINYTKAVMNSVSTQHPSRSWLSTYPILFMLLVVILASTSEKVHSQFLQIGEYLWSDYFILRGDIPMPSCDPNVDIEGQLNELEKKSTDSELDDLGLFEPEPFNREAARQSLQQQVDLCEEKYRVAKENQERVTASVIFFRSIETSIAKLSLFVATQQRLLMVLMLFVAALTTTMTRHHIAFRPIKTKLDHWVASSFQVVANLILATSSWAYRESVLAAGVEVQFGELFVLSIAGFSLLTVVSFMQLLKPPKDLEEGGNILTSILTIPLYVFMAFAAGNYFFLTEGHSAGVAIYFSQLYEQAPMFLNIGLYIWIGMMLKQTYLAELVFNIFKPWRLPAEILAFVAIVVMAVPTAFTGASGIIIIAMGVVVYEELRRVGARRQLALAATAMTGSSGVVLSPCLLVVVIAMLNNEVTTTQLFGWGIYVFLLTGFIFFLVALAMRREKMQIAPVSEALGPTIEAFKPLIPYIIIGVVIAGFYGIFLKAYLDEFSAPIILPLMVLGFIVYEKLFSKYQSEYQRDERPDKFGVAVKQATSDATVHIGALVLLMGLSFATGGVIERSGLFGELVGNFGDNMDIYTTMAYLVGSLVFVGMIMDPFGAVVLVTGSIATIAYKAGIHPIHFWMVTLVAFELGYLTPPVALNHLLTRQVVGEEEASLAVEEANTTWERLERYILPLIVMGITLMLVAFVPLIYGYDYSHGYN